MENFRHNANGNAWGASDIARESLSFSQFKVKNVEEQPSYLSDYNMLRKMTNSRTSSQPPIHSATPQVCLFSPPVPGETTNKIVQTR